MIKHFRQRLTSSLNRYSNSPAQKQQFKKHHWVMGSLVILVGSWITHTTTAMIADSSPNDLQLNNNAINKISSDKTDLGLRINTLSLAEPKDEAQTTTAQGDVTQKANTKEEKVLEPAYTTVTHQVKKGESLGIIFKKLDFDLSLPYKISKDSTAKQLVSLSIGKTLSFKLDNNNALREIHYPSTALKNLVVKLSAEDIIDAQFSDVAYFKKQQAVSGEISSSLYESALASGLSVTTIMEMVRIFGWDIDFVLDTRAGDHFHVIYEDYISDNGDTLANGNILAAEFTTQGKTYRAIRFENDDTASYYTPQGDSMLGTFLRSPVEFSRISSRFGKRKHPILKTWRAHNGVDYAASRGTPIRATADGKVTLAGKKGGYGNTVVLRHAGRFTTLYAHMSGFAKGVRRGKQVKQGDTIGYIGSTGLATGPHLHYEFRLDGVHRNPLTYKTPKASAIPAKSKSEFELLAQNWTSKLDEQQKQYVLAKAMSEQAEL